MAYPEWADDQRVPGAISVVVGTPGERTPEQDAAAAARDADQVIIDEALKRFRLTEDAESTLRKEMGLDKAFIGGDHWPTGIKAERESDGRPCLVINKLPQYINQITNQQRQSRPAIQITPIDDRGDVETAHIYQGIIRHIETNSRADLAYDNACQDQVGCGRGWWYVSADYNDADSMTARAFVQDLAIKRVRNLFRIYPDPTCQEPDYSDGRFLHDLTDLPRDEFEQTYGKEAAQQLATFETMGHSQPAWVNAHTVRVSRYWRVVTERTRIYLTAQGQVVPEDGLQQALQLTPDQTPEAVAQSGKLKSARWIVKRRVEWFLMTAAQILDRGTWRGQWIPYVPLLGIELDDNGKVDLRGIVRDSRDPQRRYDVSVSAETEAVGLMPKAPYIGYKGQFLDPKWKDANRRNYPYLESELLDINGERVPLPQRNFNEANIRGIAETIRQADSDLRTTTGYFDQFPNESVGAERSGRAILARQRQGEVGNSHFQDNLARSITFTGRILIDLIPHYYDTFRIMRITGDDGKPMTVGVYAGAGNEPRPDSEVPTGIKAVKDLSAGRYDVAAKMGKSASSAREERNETLTALAQAAPGLVPQFADVWVGSQDWDGAQELAKRLRPPTAGGGEDGQAQIPPQMQAQIQQLMQQHEALVAELNAKNDLIEKNKLELDSRERIALRQVQAQVLIAQMQAETTKSAADLKHEIDVLKQAIEADYMHIEEDRATTEAAQAALQASAQMSGPSGAPSEQSPASARTAGTSGAPTGA